ncbi:MAG TPA: SpaA isopeptide-forming pilin-related protein [Coriobacteriaceae bacterium]|nr:SpaA isopeptide-forming pilin-related protein [Coriobacteriaceae bacterium]
MIVLALAVVLTASFFLPTRAEAAVSDHTVPTISPSGTTINLFDYWVNPDNHLSVSGNGGINASHRFQFNDGKGDAPLNHWTGNTNPQPGIVSNTLSDGYPQLSGTYGGDSLRYLFDSSAQTGKTSHFGVTGLLKAQDGYYVYDSSENYAAYNADKNAFDVYDTWGIDKVGDSSHRGQFFPFDAADKVFKEESGRLVQNGITADNAGNHVNHHFGLSMSTRFVQPNGGLTNDKKDMTFEFAGDDDVWVFIDDVLVGDIGGIHSRASLSINFHTGDIKVNDNYNGTLKSKYQEAGKAGDTSWEGNTFADDTNHTLKFFYLERGATDSNMELKFNLVTVPESDIIKFDQDGKFVQSAEFALYKTDENFTDTTNDKNALLGSGTTDEAGHLTLTNDDDNGVINFDDLYNKNHGNKYYLLKETRVPEGYRSSLTATGGSMQLEYVPASAENGAGGVIINRGGMDADSVVWKTGAFAGAKETITAPVNVYKANDDLTKSNETVNLKSGILFAVVLKRDKSANADIKNQNNWYAVSGDPSTGMGYTLAEKPSKAGAIEAAKKDLHAFTLNTSGQYQVEIQNLPGDISSYYYMLSGDARKDAEYAVAIYHTTASSIANANTDNTVHVFSDDLPSGEKNFQRQFATRLLVTNIQNRLFVQKTDTEGKPVDGAKFGLYKADQVKMDANGKVMLNGEQTPFDTLTTGLVGNPVPLEGAGIFPNTSDGNRPLVKGTYFLKEVSAPKGFLLNDTLTKVIVDDYGVHADAGTADDGVSTFVGPGALMKSLGQFGAEGDIDNTLTWIKGQRQTSDGTLDDNGNLSWNNDAKGGEDEVHLKYGANGRVYQYGPTEKGKPYRLETETGWIRMGITQDVPGDTNAKVARADLGDMNLNALFTGATCVRVANKREASLEVTKRVVVPAGLTGKPDAGFTFKFTVPEGKTYKAAVFKNAGAGKQAGDVFDLKNGDTHAIKADETIRVYGLGEGDEYTVRELTGADKMPAGYKLTGRKQGTTNLTGAGDSITGEIEKQKPDGTLAEANKLVFTNTYKAEASDELTPQVTKKVSGVESTEKAFSFTLTATEETQKQIDDDDLKVSDALAGNEHAESKATSGKIIKDKGQTVDFSGMKFNKAGTYTFTLTEVHDADDDAAADGVQNSGWTMDASTYTVTVRVEDKNAKLTVTGVTVEKSGDDKRETLEVKNGKVNLATFNNSYAAKGSVTLAAKKQFTGGTLENQQFSFQVKEGDKVVAEEKNDANGDITFPAIDYTEAGEHDYAIKEVEGTDPTIVYDGKTVKVHVSVTDNKNGTLSAAATYDGEKAVPTFTNSKPTADATIEATKILKGKDLTAGAFTFGLYQGDTTTVDPIQTVQNDKDGKIKLILTGLTIGEYDYTLKEVADSDSTITYDSTAVKVHVSVKADGDKAKATVTYDDKNDAPTFTNKYQPAETLATLTAKKSYVKSDNTQATLKGGEFTFDLYEGDLTAEQLKGKQPIQTAKNGEDGTVTFPAINYTKAGEYKYTIVEQKGDLPHVVYDDAVHHAVVKVVDNAGQLEASVTYDDGKTVAPTFTNTYTAKGSVELTATKIVAVADGFKHDVKLKGGEYTFELKDAAGNVLGTAKNDADGKVSFTREFQLSDLGGAASKDFTYTIVEQSGTEPGIVYDSHALTYTVTVTDGGTGALNAKAIVTSVSGSETFTNTYQPAATGLALGAQKSYVKKDDNTPIVLKGGEFTFDVYEGNLTAEQLAGAKPVRTATNGADGSVNFDAFSYAKPGTHEYTIVERKGDLAYVTYDAAVHHAVVTVADNAGTLQASVAYDGTNVTKPSFTNTYEAQATDSGAIALTKSVDVHDGSYQLKAGDFAFELVGSDGSVIQTQKNDAHGKVAFDKLTFDHAGTFIYTVREVQPTDDAPGVPGVTYTGKTYTLTYVVKDNNDGKLVVESSTVMPSEGTENGVTPNTMTFTNSYQPGATSYQISGTKVLENADPSTTRTPADGEFTFALIDVATGQEIDRTKNVGKAFTFKAISYTATGSHAYQVKEVAGQDGTITYSDAVLDVTVSVTDDGSGQLTATANKTAADLTFTNTYTPTATTATITGTKALTGRDLAEGEFSFDLKDADGNVVQTVQNGADGTFGFAPLQLDKVGTYVYTVSERAGATANGVTYDTTVFTATVTVTENAETHALEAQVAYSKGGKAADAVAFSNSYAPAATEVKLGASKVLSGEDLKEGQFSFQLKDADGKVLQTAKNAADGTVGFEAISYDKPGTYAYSISEVDDGQKNVTYDAAEHRVTVTVTDDGAGHLVATVTYDGDVAPVFKNTYTPPTTPPVNPPTNPPSKPPVPKEEKPGLPNMGDTSLSPMALGGIAGGAVVLIAAGVILRRRNR